MTDLPPPYSFVADADLHARLSTAVKAQFEILGSISPEAQDIVAKETEKQLTASETVKKVEEEVNRLTGNVLSADKLFEEVRVELLRVDGHNYKGKDGKPLRKFAPEWKGYQDRWTNLLWKSREAAAETVEKIEDFQNFVLPKVKTAKTSEQVAKAQAALKKFAEEKNPLNRDVAQAHSQAFTDLSRDLDQFKGTFDDYTVHLQKDLDDKIKNKRQEKGRVERDMEEFKPKEGIKITQLIKDIGAILLWTGVAASAVALGTIGLGIGFLAPFVVIGAVIAGAVLAGLKVAELISENDKLNGLYVQYNGLVREIEDLTKQLEAVQKVQANLDNQKTKIIAISGCIDQIARIWSSVAFAATTVSRQLERAHKGEIDAEELLERLEYLDTNYTTLKRALVKYGTETKLPHFNN